MANTQAYPPDGLTYADTAPALARLWSDLGVSVPPAVELGREIVVAMGIFVGLGAPVCAQKRLDGISFDASGRVVTAQLEDASQFLPMPPAPSGAVSACGSPAIQAVVVVALARDHLPASPFTFRIDEAPTVPDSPLPSFEVRLTN